MAQHIKPAIGEFRGHLLEVPDDMALEAVAHRWAVPAGDPPIIVYETLDQQAMAFEAERRAIAQLRGESAVIPK